MSPTDTPDDKSPDSTADVAADEKRKARVIDGTAEDVTDAPKAGASASSGGAMSFAAPIAAFFVGAALLAAVLWQAGLINVATGVGPVAAGDVSGRLDAADTRIAALLRDVDRLGGELSAAQTARAELEAKLEGIDGAAGGIDAQSLTEGLARSDDLDAALRLITEIDGRLVDAETNAALAQTAVQPDQIEALQAVIADLETRLATAEDATEQAQAAERRVAAMEAGVAAIGAQQGTQANELGTIQAQLGALGARAAAMQDIVTAQNERLATLVARDDVLATRLGVVEARVDRPEAARRAALGIALASLSGAANDGGSFALELEAVDQLAPGAEQVEALREVADSGVADASTLLRRFQPAARAALKADAAGASQGIWDRLTGNAASLITVRRTGALEGGSVEAVLARAEVALGDGEVAKAVSLVDGLSGPAAEAMQPWLTDARARANVDALIGDMRRVLLVDLAQAHSPGADENAVSEGATPENGSAVE